MISQSQVAYFREVGIWYTGVKAFDSSIHISSLREFLNQNQAYKDGFLQTKFDSVFEGYSYLGQEDSANQYADDQLFTYVISDYFDTSRHAKEVQPIIQSQQTLIPKVQGLERILLKALSPELIVFYDCYAAHSLSANYYPPNENGGLRLTAHPDGSLLTVFPFGMDEEFQFETPDGAWKTVEKTNEVVIFSGYLMECLTDIKALNHKVEKKGKQNERFSFAYFSVPRPNEKFLLDGKMITGKDYYTRYLSLFDQ